MNQKEMLGVLENMRYAFQRFRSMVSETQEGVPNLTPAMLEDMYPWVFGPKCPLPAIQKVLDRGSVTGQEFYNFLFILHRFCPDVIVAHSSYNFPEPSLNMIMAGP